MINTKKDYFDELRAKVSALASSKTIIKDSEGYYQPSLDHAGTGSAIIRLLPRLTDEDCPFVQIYNHAFQGPTGKWYIDNCATTLNQPCPVCDLNAELGSGANRNLASVRKRKMYFISNVLIVRDPRAPENDGKVFLYKYGVKIMDKIDAVISQPSGDVEAIDPFDAEEGANLRLRIIRKDGFPDYEQSSFDSPSAIGDEGVIASVLSKRHSLVKIIDPCQFKGYDDLKLKFDQIVGVPKVV